MKTFTVVVFFLLVGFGAAAQTNVSGFISANTTWNLAGSPYIVISNALVSNGYTLTIEPGVVVKFEDSTALQIDGELIAIGTSTNRITFTSNKAIPAPGDWAKLHFSSYSTSAAFDSAGGYLSGSILKYCDVLYAGQLGFGEVHIVSASPYITHCNIKYSAAAGTYCSGSSHFIDSSTISDNADYGLFFTQSTQNSCGLEVKDDTVRNNGGGGLKFDRVGCTTVIKNNYFISNQGEGAIFSNGEISDIFITHNYFLNNSATSGSYKAVVLFQPYPLNNIIIADNYFSGNSGDEIIMLRASSTDIYVLRNYFVNNTSEGAIISNDVAMRVDTIACNTFLNNQTRTAIIRMGTAADNFGGLITKNLFEGNTNITPGGVSVLSVNAQDQKPLIFSHNVVRGNSTPNGSGIYIKPYLNNNVQLLQIHHNEFSNNALSKIIRLEGVQINNSALNFMYLSYNNFLDAATSYTLYNQIPYGSPNILAVSNYWGSTSIQHVDSIIYDYFDFANQSVVYYSPILSSPVLMDTACLSNVTCNIQLPVISAAQTTICANESVSVCAPLGYLSYLWNIGQTGRCINLNLAGNYYVTVSDVNGCTAESNHLAITVYTLPPVAISVNGDTLSVYGALTQQWYLNGSAINGATNNIYIANQSGSYTVAVTDTNGCVATSSPVIISGIDNLSEDDMVSVYQLTVTGWQLTVGNNWIGGTAEVFDANGRFIFHSLITNHQSLITPDVSSGVYLLRVSSSKSSIVKKLVRL